MTTDKSSQEKVLFTFFVTAGHSPFFHFLLKKQKKNYSKTCLTQHYIVTDQCNAGLEMVNKNGYNLKGLIMYTVSMPWHTGGVLRQGPAGLVVGNWLTLPRRRGHLAFPSTGRQQQNAAAQHLAPCNTHTHTHTISYLYTYKRKYILQCGSATMPQ